MMSIKNLKKQKKKSLKKVNAAKKASTTKSSKMKSTIKPKKKRSSEEVSNDLEIMPTSAGVTKLGHSIENVHEEWWEELSDYIDASKTFDREIWENIRSTITAGKLTLERLVAKCVRDQLPKRYKMTQGEFFGEFFGLKDYQVSKMVSRDRIRALITDTLMDGDYIKDALVDKISAFSKKNVSENLLIDTLMELCEDNSLKYPSVAQYESRVVSILTENEHRSRLQQERESYLRNYDLNAVENSQIADSEGEKVSGITKIAQEGVLSEILIQLSAIQQSLKRLEGDN
ncbi:hypothetical protein [Alteromonas sp. H39]|uniref:hypothetical protein n=1 Tax=Alteromonas sp. H39 TaxID=3389876 RepID=UPI0039E1CA99